MLHELWPELCEEELRIVDEALVRYLEIAWDIYEESEAKNSPS